MKLQDQSSWFRRGFPWPSNERAVRLIIESDPVILTTSSRIYPVRGEDENEGIPRSGRPAESAGRAAGSDRRPAAGSMGDGIAADPIGFGTPPMLPWFYPRCAGRCPMSTMMKVRSRFPSSSKVAAPAPIKATKPGRHSSHLKPMRPERGGPGGIRSERPSTPESWQREPRRKPPTPDEEFPTPLLKVSLPTAEAGAERSGQAKWPAWRPHRTVLSATPLDGSYLDTEDIEFLTLG